MRLEVGRGEGLAMDRRVVSKSGARKVGKPGEGRASGWRECPQRPARREVREPSTKRREWSGAPGEGSLQSD